MKQPPAGTAERVAAMTITKIYPMYVAKVEKKRRTQAELDQVIGWLTGYSPKTLRALIDSETTIGAFFDECTLNPNAHRITGTICGYRIETLEDPFLQKTRYLDKLVDELAKGKAMEKILRTDG